MKERIFIMEQRNELTSQPMLLTIPQVATKLGLSRAMVYILINREGLPVIRLGRAVRVSTTSLQKWVEEREQSSRLSQDEQRFSLGTR
jgi:excisionase family DNA binding protein